MPAGKFYYVIRATQDGGAAVEFYTDKEAAQLARDIDVQQGIAVKGGAPQEVELEFGRDGALLSPDASTAELRQRLSQVTAAKPVAEAAASNAVEFTAAAKPKAPVKQVVLANITSLEGKSVAFAGRTIMSRPRLKQYAKDLGVELEEFVNSKTDFVVVGEDMGSSKVDRAHELGVPVITEAQWFDLVKRIQGDKKPAAAAPTP